MKTTSIKSASLILMALFMSISISIRADVTPSVLLKTYYSAADGKASGQLRTALYGIINPHTTVSYDNLAYLMKYSDTQDADGTNVVDIYSSCTFTVTSDKLTWTSNGGTVGNGMNREHTVPQSWFGKASPMVSDAFHVYPTDARSNNNRSDNLYGEFTGAGTSNYSSSCSESGKLSGTGTQTIAEYTYKGEDYSSPSSYSGRVYEPADEYKGDIARSYFYMATCYANECATWNGGAFGTDNEGFTNYTAELMLKWHRLDPVSEKELIRNEVIYGNTTYNKSSYNQGNRNPFIDYPELVEYIWGEKKGIPVSLDDLTSAYSVPCSGKLTTPSVTAVAGDQQITLTWSDVSGATGYTVNIGAGVGYTTECSSPSIGAITHSGTTNTCVITGLVNGLSYTTSVIAKGSTTCDSDADEDNTTPTDVPVVTNYTIRFFDKGVQVGSTQNLLAGATAVKPSDPTPCTGDYTFVGWWTAALAEDNTTAETWVTDFTVSGDQDYYAVFSKTEGGGVVESWEKTYIDYLSEEDIFVIVGNGTYALPNDATGTPSVVSVTISGDEITSDVADNLKWNLTGTILDGFTFYPNGNKSKWLYCNTTSGTGSNNNIRIGTGNRKTWISSGEQLRTSDSYTARYLAIYSSTDWRSYNSSTQATTAITFYKYTTSGGSTTYYTTSPSCESCDYKVTLTKGEESHGTFTLDKADGVYDNCEADFVVTVSGITTDEGYELADVTATGEHVTVSGPDGSGNYTVTYTQGYSITSTINVTFAAIPPRTFTFVPGSGICATTELTEGVWNAGVTLPTATANSGCDPEYVFAGWATALVADETDVRPTLYNAGDNYNGETLTLYAVYAQITGGGAGFTISYSTAYNTYYASGRTGTNTYMDASTNAEEAARFSIVTSNDKQYLCWHNGTTDTYISSTATGKSTKTNLSFTTDLSSATSWTVTETETTIILESNGNSRNFMFNTNQMDRFAAYADETPLNKVSLGTTVYHSVPSCECTSVDITYDANGGTLDEGCGNVVGGPCENDWKLCDAPTRNGYLFTGWKDQNDNLYNAGASITDLKSSLTLTAQWIPAPYIVLFDAGTGTCVESLTEASRGDGITLPKAEPSAACSEDWTFIGWSETKLVGETNTTAAIIGVSGVNYIPTANNTTLYAVYRKVDTEFVNPNYTRVTDDPIEGDYVIVLAQGNESFGLLTYGTISGGRLTYTETYTALPASISSPAATQIWHLTFDGDGYAYLYNANAGAYLAADGSNISYDVYGGSKFRFTRNPGTYGDFRCLNYTASDYDNYYLGANASSNYIRYYKGQTLVDLYSVTLYQGSAGTRYYSTEPNCTPCEDPEWSFALGTNVVKAKGSAPFINTVNKGHESAGTVTYSSTNEAVATVDNTGLVTLVGTGTTTITLRLTRAMPYCAAVLQYELEVKDPSIEVVGVTADGEIIIEHDLDGTISIDLSEGNTVSTGTAANDIFFSKYFEAASNMKLFAIFNGTGHEVDLSNIRIRSNCITGQSSVWPTKTGDFGYVELSNISKLREQYPKLKIPSGTELVFWSNNKTTAAAGNSQLRNCIEITIGEMTYNYSDLEAGEVPNWYCLGGYINYEDKDEDGNNQFVFNGDDSMIMERYNPVTGQWEAIDLFGAGTSVAPASTEGVVEWITDEYEIDGEMQALNDGPGFHANCAGNPIPLSTNRYMLIRKNSVLDGMNAVASNTTSFATLCSEWNGTPVGGSTSAFCYSGEMFSEIGEYNYSENYIDWTVITNDQYTTEPNTDGTVTITFTGTDDLDDRACQLLKIEVRDNATNQVLATSEYKIPIVVKEGEVMTSAELFHGQGDKCATCDVAILGSATLTKVTDGTPNDMPTVRDIYVYGGGNLIIPSGTHYNAHDLIMRTQVADDKINMDVPNIQVQGSLTNQYGGSIRMQTRVGTSRFYQFSVPYEVSLDEVTFSDGTPAVYGDDFMIRYYDGEKRAATQAGNNWRNYEGTKLYPGVGYTLAVAKKTGHTQRELIFPMADASLVDGEPATKTTTIYAWGDNSIRANHRGWNFLSNPYLTTYAEDNLDDDAGNMLTTGRLIEDAEHPGWWVNDEGGVPYVTLINSTRTDYTQELVALQELPPFTTFFVQVGNDLTSAGDVLSLIFDRTNRKVSAPAYIRAAQKATVARFGVLLSGNNAKDNCGMVIGENYSAAYDMQADLSKEFGSAYSLKLYTLHEDQMQMAFQATHPDSLNKPIPVGVRLPANAEYTFAIDRRYHLGAFDHIYLTDNETGRHTDLLEDTYSFSGMKQQINTRFSLFVQLRQDITTGTDNLLNGIYAVGREGSVLLSGLPEKATIYIYDMNGRMVMSRQTQGVSSVTYDIPTGVYQIRIQAEGANTLLRTIVY